MDVNNNQEKISGGINNKKAIAIIIIVGLFFILFLINHKKSSDSTSVKKVGSENDLKSRLNEILQLENKHEFEKIYDDYFSPETKARLKKEAYVNEAKGNFENKIYSSEISINDVKIDGDVGYADRTRVDCLDEKCTSKKQTRSYKKYVFVDNNWRMVVEDNPIHCVRNTGYEMPEEFKRSLSLIIQRYSQSDIASLQNDGSSIRNIQNCLDIQYAKPSDNISAAEGMFVFTPSQSMEKFDVLVSPKYAAKDDLLTSVLLMHEIKHVFDFINGQSSGNPVGCFETEARAFSAQNFFVTNVLNNEEVKSLNARIRTNSSEEARQIAYVVNAIPRSKGNDYQEKALNFVKASPVYQEQCKDRE